MTIFYLVHHEAFVSSPDHSVAAKSDLDDEHNIINQLQNGTDQWLEFVMSSIIIHLFKTVYLVQGDSLAPFPAGIRFYGAYCYCLHCKQLTLVFKRVYCVNNWFS